MKTNERAYWTSVFTTAIDNPIDATTAPSGLPAPLPALSADLAEALEVMGKTADDIRADVGKVQAWRRGQVLVKRLEQALAEQKELDAKLIGHQKAHGVKSTPTSDAMVKRAVTLALVDLLILRRTIDAAEARLIVFSRPVFVPSILRMPAGPEADRRARDESDRVCSRIRRDARRRMAIRRNVGDDGQVVRLPTHPTK